MAAILENIVSRDTFLKATRGREIAGLFFYCALDPLFELADWIASDFLDRPKRYADVEDDTVTLLTQLRFQYGTEPNVPNKAQREAIYEPVFGPWNGTQTVGGSGFPMLRDQLFQAATPIIELHIDTGITSLILRFLDILPNMQSELQAYSGSSLRNSENNILDKFATEVVFPILRSQKIGARFLSPGSATTEYPYGADSAREKLVALAWGELAEGKDTPSMTMNQDAVVNLRTLAVTGADAIAEAIAAGTSRDEDEIKELARRWYQFGCAWANARSSSRSPAPPPTPAARVLTRPAVAARR